MNQTGKNVRAIAGSISRDAATKIKAFIAGGLAVDQEMKLNPRVPPMTMLNYAAERGALAVAKVLTAAGARLDKGKYSKPLQIAVLFGRQNVVRWLLAAGADPNATIPMASENDTGLTALMTAAGLPDKPELLKLLLKHGADPHRRTKNGRTALSMAVGYHNQRAIGILLKAGCRASGDDLYGPVYHGEVEGVRQLVRAGADVNFVRHGKYGLAEWSLLETAIRQRPGFIVGMSDMFVPEKRRSQAAQFKEFQAYRKEKADESRRYLETVKVLIQAGADVNHIAQGDAPLYCAASGGDLEVVKVLLNAKADPKRAIRCVSWKGIYEETALHAVAGTGDLRIAKTLVSAGAEINRPDRDGKTPLDRAYAAEQPAMIEWLEKSGAIPGKTA